jgi:hypothetical protein
VEVVWDGTTQSIEVAQSQRGFGMIEEDVMETYLSESGKAAPVPKDPTIDRTTDLQMACIACAEPAITDSCVAQRLNRAFMMAHADHYADLHVDPATLADVVTPSEAKEIASYAARSQQVVATKELMQHTRKTHTAAYKFKKAARKIYNADDKKQPRWLPIKTPTAGKVVKWIEKFTPSTIVIDTDDYNGRWRVISSDLSWKSISWTKRGWETAACETLYWAWKLHSDEFGEESPFDLSEFQQRFRDEGVEETAGG